MAHDGSADPLTTPEARIHARIAEAGTITFAEFMELALYGPGGYYTRPGRIGGRGDYFTSPHAHPIFGALIALQLEQCWELLGSPSLFTVCEPGAGDGRLAQDVQAYAQNLDAAFAQALACRPYDRAQGGPALGDPFVGAVLSNELVDALPVHRVLVEEGRLREIYVAHQDGKLVEALGGPSTPAIEAQLASEGVSLVEGWTAEVPLAAAAWMRGVAARLDRGFVFTIDYGDLAQDLYVERRRRGTLTSYYRHAQTSDPYHRVGSQDLTSHANFTTLIQAGEAEGLRPVVLFTQREFLTSLGAGEMIQALSQHALPPDQRQANLRAVQRLLDPQGLGNFRVLVQAKDAPGKELACLRAGNAYLERLRSRLAEGLPLPLLDEQRLDSGEPSWTSPSWEAFTPGEDRR